MLPEHKSSLREIVGLFDEAERKVKEVERLSQELSVPSINELRYVGYHIARAICDDDSSKISDEIKKAKGHCQRAIYDAHEIGIIHLLERVKVFKEMYPNHAHVAAEVLPTYIEDCRKANEASKFISQVHENGSSSREQYYSSCAPHYTELLAIVGRVDEAIPLIDGKIASNQRADLKLARRFIITVVIAIIGTVVAGTTLYLKMHGAE